MCVEPNPATADLKSRDLLDERRHTATEATPTGEKDESEQSAPPQQRSAIDTLWANNKLNRLGGYRERRPQGG